MIMAEKISKLIIEKGGKEYEFSGGGGSGTPAPNSVNSASIEDGSVQMEDLNDDVKNKLQKSYDQGDEALYMDFDEKAGDGL